MSDRKLVVGLGNPGVEYRDTRHNLGFMMLDAIVGDAGYDFTYAKKFTADMAELQVKDTRVTFVKPRTFYNESGQSVRAIIDFYKLSSQDVLVIHDELAISFGIIRARIDGSHAGNNGIKSIIAHVGQDFRRIRIGIKNDFWGRTPDTDFVLGKFTGTERALFPSMVAETKDLLLQFVTDDNFASNTRRLSRDKS